ncbi:TPM domain-containing protein [Rhodobacter ferrooxidans]|uniref:TPM domain-containing protein n=1 Tax=Rhodobacter ferrooxidans TaxID=371731 RepID=C8RZN1_9RHOB|nr:TPM domain-containing protein [Rhodobacter sp. SW2]EEW25828.1 protein of unknown function DUF477 [Rhodobacter sp. SW2]
MIRLLAVLLFLPCAVLAQSFPEHTSVYVNDFAQILDDASETRIAQALEAVRDDTGVQANVVTISRRADYGDSASIEAFAKDLFNHWGIGNAARNDGILILVASEDREMRIALGSAYPPVWDGVALRIIDTQMLPAFRDGNMAAGIEAGTLATIDRIARPFTAGQPAPEAPTTPFDPTPWMFGGAVLLSILVAARGGLANLALRFRTCPACGKRGLHRDHTTLTEPTKLASGVQRIRTACNSCDYHRDVERTIPSLSSSGGGGSFGGGSSSGGGASGRW